VFGAPNEFPRVRISRFNPTPGALLFAVRNVVNGCCVLLDARGEVSDYGVGMKSTTILRITTLLTAGVSLVLSVWLYFADNASIDDRLNGIFVGIWVPSILALGNFLINSSEEKG